ncbi:MAG TPA: hypothetical protein VJ695_05780 [Nitrososphaera sp.]|nr:hypothetical protein [Nitrososphaera sp.]
MITDIDAAMNRTPKAFRASTAEFCNSNGAIATNLNYHYHLSTNDINQ